jgi:tetratricopeptide (TPR) repeat protein
MQITRTVPGWPRGVIMALLAIGISTTTPQLARAAAADDANAGMDALNAGQYAKAVTLFTRALKSKRLSAEDTESAYVERGKAYLGEHKETLALADFDAALKLNPSDQEASSLRANVQGSSTGSIDTGEKVRSALSKVLQDAIAFAQAGNGQAATKKVHEAEAMPNLTPSESLAISQTENYVAAKTGGVLGNSPAKAQFEAGKAAWQAGDCASAEAQFRQGLALDPVNPAANYYYGDCLAKDQNYDAAVAALRLAVQYGKGIPEGDAAIEEIKQLAPPR